MVVLLDYSDGIILKENLVYGAQLFGYSADCMYGFNTFCECILETLSERLVESYPFVFKHFRDVYRCKDGIPFLDGAAHLKSPLRSKGKHEKRHQGIRVVLVIRLYCIGQEFLSMG